MYRPDNWSNPYREFRDGLDSVAIDAMVEVPQAAYEAGADALLGALMEGGVYGQYTEGVDEGPWLVDDDKNYFDIADVVDNENKRGYLVFIPDD